jgi:hypothetical protein
VGGVAAEHGRAEDKSLRDLPPLPVADLNDVPMEPRKTHLFKTKTEKVGHPGKKAKSKSFFGVKAVSPAWRCNHGSELFLHVLTIPKAEC